MPRRDEIGFHAPRVHRGFSDGWAAWFPTARGSKLEEEPCESHSKDDSRLRIDRQSRSASDAGDHREAETLARAAVGFVPHEMLNLRADVLVDFAEVVRAAGQEQGAAEAFEEAARSYERKGNVVSAERGTRALYGPV